MSWKRIGTRKLLESAAEIDAELRARAATIFKAIEEALNTGATRAGLQHIGVLRAYHQMPQVEWITACERIKNEFAIFLEASSDERFSVRVPTDLADLEHVHIVKYLVRKSIEATEAAEAAAAASRAAALAAVEAKELAELERLQAKYGTRISG
jgi:hypothetical protein